MERPEWLLNVDAESYHAATKNCEYTTSHRLNTFRRCPQLYHKIVTGQVVEGDTAAFAFGRAVHTLVIEGRDKFDAEYVVCDGPLNDRTGKPFGKATQKYADWLAEQPLPVISTEEFSLMENLRNAVHGHAAAHDILSAGIAEGTIRTKWDDEPVQCRMDWFDPERGILADLKTCEDLDLFPRDIAKYNYIAQLAFYAKCLALAGYKGDVRAVLIAVEKKEPFRVAVVELYPYTLDEGNVAEPGTKHGPGNDFVMRELIECRKADTWPTRYEEVIHM